MIFGILSFLVVLILLPYWIRRMKSEGLTGKDLHKPGQGLVAEAGGIVVLFGFTVAVMAYVGTQTFGGGREVDLVGLFALLTVVFIASFIGFIDDLLGWKKGLSQWMRIVMVGFAAVPLMVIEAGQSIIFDIPIGLFYPLVVIPIAVVGATTTFNFIAGYNGLEAGMGIILMSGMGYVCFHYDKIWLMVVCMVMVGALVAFLLYNRYPARIFPGDSLTYQVGALAAVIAIFGNFEKTALVFFIPYGIEAILKVRGGLKKESFAKLDAAGRLVMPYEKVYGLEHWAIKVLGKWATEQKVVWMLWGLELIFVIMGIQFFMGNG